MLRISNIKLLLKKTSAAAVTILATASISHACPLIGGLIDYNCDGKHKVVVVGDSIVFGIGDLANKNKGGYVLRLQKKFKQSEFVNLGQPGFTTQRLYELFKSLLSTSKIKSKKLKAIKDGLQDADLIMIDAGRNDFFDLKIDEVTGEVINGPGMTVRNIARLVDLFKTELGKDSAIGAPYITVSSLLPTTRGFQRPFIEETNSLLFMNVSENLPVFLHFETINKSLISSDGIHPTSKGYNSMAKEAASLIKNMVQQDCKILRPDTDKDGIYDKFELKKYKTDPTIKDTDGDGISDGDEVFFTFTNPIAFDAPVVTVD